MDNLRLGVEWDVNESELKASMDRSRKSIEGAGQSVEVVEAKVNNSLQKLATRQEMLDKSWEQLNIQARSYARIVVTSLDPNVVAKYNKMLHETQAEMARIKAMGMDMAPTASSRSGWNGLQNSINQISRELPAFTYSAQIGFMAISNNIPILADEINRLRAENAALNAEGKKGVPIWKQVATSLFSWQTAMSVGITLLTVYGKEIGEWIKAIFQGGQAAQQAAVRIEAMNTALASSEYGKAIKDLAELRSAMNGARDGVVSKDDALKLYNSTIGNTSGEIKEWQKLEQWMVDNEQKYLQFMFRKAQAQAMLQVAIDKTVEAEKKALEGPNWADYLKAFVVSGSGNLEAGANIQNFISASQTRAVSGRAMKMFEEANRELQEYAKANGFDLYEFNDEKSKNSKAKMIAAHKSLMDEIRSIDAEYAQKFMTDQQKEQAAFEEKFAKLREKIIDFNKNPDNKIKIDMEIVDEMQGRLQEQLTYSQDTDALVKMYRSEFESWKEFEELKNKVSEDYARERFGTLADYYKDVEARVWEEIGKIAPDTTDPKELKRLESLQKVLQEISSYEDDQLSELMSRLITYDQKRKDLINKFEQERLKVVQRGNLEELKEFDRRHVEELNQLDDANIQKLAEYKALFDGIQKLSDTAARKVIADAKKMLLSEKDMSPQTRKNIQNAIAEAEQALDDRMYDRVDQISNAFGQMSHDIGQVNEGLGSMLGLLSNVLRATVQVGEGVKDLRKGIANYQEQRSSGSGGFLGSVSAIAGVAGPVGQIVGAVSSVVSGIVGFFKAAKESARQAAEEMRRYQESVLAGEIEYNRLLRERAREQKNINDLTVEQIKLQQQLLKTQTSDAVRDYEAVLRRIQSEGEQITGQKTEKYGGFLGIGRKTRVVDITASLDGYTYEQLEELYTSNKLTEATRYLFEQLRAAKEEIDGIADSWDAMQEELLSKMSGGIDASNISKSIIQGIRDGKRAWDDFADYGEEIVENALLSAMSATVLEEPLMELVRQFREDAKDGLNLSEIDAFKKGYKEIVESGLEAIKEIEELTGKGIGSGEDGSKGMSGRIQSITQQQADVLAGQVMGIHLAVVKGQELNQKVYEVINSNANDFRNAMLYWRAIADNTSTTASNTNRLERIEYWLEKIGKGNNNSIRAGGNG